MQERPHLTRLLGVASLVAALALLFRIVAAITSMTAPDQAFATTAGWTSAGARLHADEERAAAIRDTIRSLREECQRSAGGDWNRWVEQLSPFRASLLKRIREAKPYNLQAEGSFEARSSVLEGRGDFALFESSPEYYLRYLYDPESLDGFRKRRPVVAAARWLKSQGINVIFVPVPKMTEVYAEHFADYYPSDRVVALTCGGSSWNCWNPMSRSWISSPSSWRQETRIPRRFSSQPILTGRPGWAIAAHVVGERLKRYPFVTMALESPRICQPAELPFPPASQGATYLGLSPGQRRRAESVHPRTYHTVQSCTRPLHDPASAVIVIGDSFNGGFWELLSQEINLPIGQLSGGGHTTDAFKDFLRDPGSLKQCKVVVWLVCDTSLIGAWPLPKPIRKFSDR